MAIQINGTLKCRVDVNRFPLIGLDIIQKCPKCGHEEVSLERVD